MVSLGRRPAASRLLVAFVALTIAGAACSPYPEATRPLVGDYALVSVNGQPLPAPLPARGELFADTLRFDSASHAVRVRFWTVSGSVPGAEPAVVYENFDYRRAGRRLELRHMCGPGEECAPTVLLYADTGWVSPDQTSIAVRAFVGMSEKSTLLYARVAP